MKKDPTLERIWKVRREIYAQCDNDPQKLVEFYLEQQRLNPQQFPKKPRKVRNKNGKHLGKVLSGAALQMEAS